MRDPMSRMKRVRLGERSNLDDRFVKRSGSQTSFEQRSKPPNDPTRILRGYIWSIRHGDVRIAISLSIDLQ